jgi:hypothetical protein
MGKVKINCVEVKQADGCCFSGGGGLLVFRVASAKASALRARHAGHGVLREQCSLVEPATRQALPLLENSLIFHGAISPPQVVRL